ICITMTENIVLKDLLIDDFARLEGSVNGQAETSFFQQQKQAFQLFETLGFPTPKNEEWKYSNVKKIINESYAINTPSDVSVEDIHLLDTPDLEGNILYFVNGVYQAQ